MRHRVSKKRLSRSTSHRIAMMRNMVTSLIEHERIETTIVKAKELRKLAERMITLGKEGSLSARRRAIAIVRSKGAVSKLFADLAARFKDRKGGYTRILKTGFRLGDAAPMALIEYVDYDPSKKLKMKQEEAATKEEAKKKKPAKSKEEIKEKAEKKAIKKPERKTVAKKEVKAPKNAAVKKTRKQDK